MSVRRSPPSGTAISGGGTCSTPDLRILEDSTFNVTCRKRKQPDHDCDYKTQLEDFRKEIMSFFENFATSQNENFSQLHTEISELKVEIQNNKKVTESLIMDQTHTKLELDNVKILNHTIEQKLKQIENDVSILKNKCDEPAMNTNPLALNNEDTILELQDRYRRANNVIVAGLPEIKSTNKYERFEHDKSEVLKIIKTIFPECPEPLKTSRLGKYISGKNRPIKVYFASQDTAMNILRNKTKGVLGDVLIYSDQTPLQQQYFKKVRAELIHRQQSGETDLTIKYKGGVPHIVKSSAKNDY